MRDRQISKQIKMYIFHTASLYIKTTVTKIATGDTHAPIARTPKLKSQPEIRKKKKTWRTYMICYHKIQF